MHIAVIGAGISGLTCARQLQAQGHQVRVFEKSRAPSGRMTTHETEFGGFDYGAQYFTADADGFKKEVAAWRKAEVVAPWGGTLVKLADGSASAVGRVKQRFVAIPGMNALGKHLALGLDVRTEQMVTRIEPYGKDGAHGKQWKLALQSNAVGIAAHGGPFDAVLVAAPADQAALLLAAAPELAQQASAVHLAPCWSLMLAFQVPLDLGYDGAWIDQARLSWIARDASKPAHRAGERWVGHASAAWSVEHLEDDPERIKEKMLKAFHEATGSHVQPIYAEAHRWRFAQAIHPIDGNCLWDAELKIGACGDWFSAGLEGGGRVENAYTSGLMLAQQIG
jgi:predicted NAD/FAD-dependent oxidoreductase